MLTLAERNRIPLVKLKHFKHDGSALRRLLLSFCIGVYKNNLRSFDLSLT